jgi:hypothetical protein
VVSVDLDAKRICGVGGGGGEVVGFVGFWWCDDLFWRIVHLAVVLLRV